MARAPEASISRSVLLAPVAFALILVLSLLVELMIAPAVIMLAPFSYALIHDIDPEPVLWVGFLVAGLVLGGIPRPLTPWGHISVLVCALAAGSLEYHVGCFGWVLDGDTVLLAVVVGGTLLAPFLVLAFPGRPLPRRPAVWEYALAMGSTSALFGLLYGLGRDPEVTGAEPAALALAFLVVHVALGGVARYHAAKP